MKKFLIKLVANFQPRMNLGRKRFNEEANMESQLSDERREQIMENRDKKYVSERTTPLDSEILGPSDSARKEEA